MFWVVEQAWKIALKQPSVVKKIRTKDCQRINHHVPHIWNVVVAFEDTQQSVNQP